MEIVTHSEYEIFNEYAESGELIKKASHTCYQSEAKSNKSKEQMIEMLKKNGHTAMLEFSWFPILITPLKDKISFFDSMNLLVKTFSPEKYLNVTVVDSGVVISGNGRSWFECLTKDKKNQSSSIHRSIYNFFNTLNEALFTSDDKYTDSDYFIEFLTKERIQQKEKTLNSDPIFTIEQDVERKKHDWFSVKFFGVSRGFTHELVRHRVMSFAQMSTRYVPLKNFKFVLGDHAMLNNKVDMKKIEDCLEQVQLTYNYLINRGLQRDVIRQILPIGVSGEIVMAGNIEGWEHVFKLRTTEKAHWEIRLVMNDLKKELIESYGYIF